MAAQQWQVLPQRFIFVGSNVCAGEDRRDLSPNQSLKTHLENKSEKNRFGIRMSVSSPCVPAT